MLLLIKNSTLYYSINIINFLGLQQLRLSASQKMFAFAIYSLLCSLIIGLMCYI